MVWPTLGSRTAEEQNRTNPERNMSSDGRLSPIGSGFQRAFYCILAAHVAAHHKMPEAIPHPPAARTAANIPVLDRAFTERCRLTHHPSVWLGRSLSETAVGIFALSVRHYVTASRPQTQGASTNATRLHSCDCLRNKCLKGRRLYVCRCSDIDR